MKLLLTTAAVLLLTACGGSDQPITPVSNDQPIQSQPAPMVDIIVQPTPLVQQPQPAPVVQQPTPLEPQPTLVKTMWCVNTSNPSRSPNYFDWENYSRELRFFSDNTVVDQNGEFKHWDTDNFHYANLYTQNHAAHYAFTLGTTSFTESQYMSSEAVLACNKDQPIQRPVSFYPSHYECRQRTTVFQMVFTMDDYVVKNGYGERVGEWLINTGTEISLQLDTMPSPTVYNINGGTLTEASGWGATCQHTGGGQVIGLQAGTFGRLP